MTVALILLYLLVATTSLAYSSNHEIHHINSHADVVIVGGGIAGYVLANRLSEDSHLSVHLLEAGSDPTEDPSISTPAFAGILGGTKYMWNLTTTPQKFLDNATYPTEQGHALGGGSTVNYMGYARGAASVYDEWASITGDEGWAWKNLLQYFKKSTKLVLVNETFSPVVDQQVYGNGPVTISFERDSDILAQKWVDLFKDLDGLPQVDANAGNGIFVNYYTHSTNSINATRVSSLTAYGYSANKRPNLTIIKNAWVSKINFSGTRATSVTYTDTLTDTTHIIHANHEIIITAGAVMTPKLLMLSGIGSRAHLESLAIPVLADLPVGKNVQDHWGATIGLKVINEQWSASLLSNATYFAKAMENYTTHHSGQLAQPVANVAAAGRVPDAVLLAAGAQWHLNLPKDRPHLYYQFANAPFDQYPMGTNVVSIIVFIVAPESRGEVRLASADYRDNPILDSNVFGTEGDRAVILWGYKHARAMAREQRVADVVLGELYPGLLVDDEDDEAIWKAIKKAVFEFRHPVGTVSLGAVLNNDLTIKGLQGIRVADSSIMPVIPSTYTAAATYAIAERAADIIKKGLQHKSQRAHLAMDSDEL